LAEKNQADAGVCLAAARICYESLAAWDEGVEWAERAKKKDDATPDHLMRFGVKIFSLLMSCIQSNCYTPNIQERSEDP